MAKERLSMRKIKEVLRLHFEHHQSARQIARSCDIARSTVKEYLHRAQQAALPWPLPAEKDDAALENRLFPPVPLISPEKRQMPPMEYLHRERKRKGVTLQLLWHEYKQANPDGYQYSQFCERYRQWVQKLDVCLHQEYRAGEKLFVDYAGQTVSIQDPQTGQTREAYLCPSGPPGSDQGKLLKFKKIGSENGSFPTLNPYFCPQNCQYKARHTPSIHKHHRFPRLHALPNASLNVVPVCSGHHSNPP
jgi:hypothetical protein